MGLLGLRLTLLLLRLILLILLTLPFVHRQILVILLPCLGLRLVDICISGISCLTSIPGSRHGVWQGESGSGRGRSAQLVKVKLIGNVGVWLLLGVGGDWLM